MDKYLILLTQLQANVSSEITPYWEAELKTNKNTWSKKIGAKEVLKSILGASHFQPSWLHYYFQLYSSQEVFNFATIMNQQVLPKPHNSPKPTIGQEGLTQTLSTILLQLITAHNMYALQHLWNWLEPQEKLPIKNNEQAIHTTDILKLCIYRPEEEQIHLNTFTQHCVLAGFMEGIVFFSEKETQGLEQFSHLTFRTGHVADSLKLALINNNNFHIAQYVAKHLNFLALHKNLQQKIKKRDTMSDLIKVSYSLKNYDIELRDIIQTTLLTLQSRNSYFFHADILNALLANPSLKRDQKRQILRFYKLELRTYFEREFSPTNKSNLVFIDGFIECFSALLSYDIYTTREIQKLQKQCSNVLKKSFKPENALQKLQILLTQKELKKITPVLQAALSQPHKTNIHKI